MIGKAIPILPSRDLDATASMFARIGFGESRRYDGYSIIERDGVELHYFAMPDHDPGSTAGSAYIRVAGVDALHAEVVAAGFAVLADGELRRRWEEGASLERISALEDKAVGPARVRPARRRQQPPPHRGAADET